MSHALVGKMLIAKQHMNAGQNWEQLNLSLYETHIAKLCMLKL